jgi:endonuclease YncB( thermonuclease family)
VADLHRAQWDRAIIGAFLLVGLIYGLSAVPAMAENIRGTASVIDGDTLAIHGQRIRLHGVDAPESSQLCLQSDGKSGSVLIKLLR